MQVASGVVLDELSRKVSTSDPASRDTMLVKLGELFSGVSHMLDETGIETFDAIFLSLAPVCGSDALAQLSTMIAENPKAPRRSIRRLAFDDEIIVARPVITLSPLLLDEDQLALATVKSPEHLLALCGRKALTTGVTDIILSRADGRIRVALACNPGARLSERGRERLIEASIEDDELYDIVAHRPELGELSQPQIRPQPAPAREAGRHGSTLPVAEVEARIMSLLQTGRIDDALKVVASHLNIPAMPVAKAFAVDIHGGFIAYARAAELSWGVTELFLKRRYEAGGVASRLYRAQRDFEALKLLDAKRVVSLLVKHAPATAH